MRSFRRDSSPYTLGLAAAVLPLLVLTSACSRESKRNAVAPMLRDRPSVTGARWVWEPSALASAVRAAGSSPLVQRALSEAPIPAARVHARHDLAIRAIGDATDGGAVGLTILPYEVRDDPTHAAFVSVAEGYGAQVVEFAEMILGRDPMPDEIGFHQVVWNGKVAWIRSSEGFVATSESARPSPAKRQWTKLFDCLATRMPTGCAAGAAIANELVPGEPRATAIGCGIGAAAGAASCAIDFLVGR